MKPEPQAFLNVERSVCGKRWIDRLDIAASGMAGAIAQQTELPEILARIVAARGVAVEDAQTFIAPTIRDLMPDPSTLAGMDGLAQRLADALTPPVRCSTPRWWPTVRCVSSWRLAVWTPRGRYPPSTLTPLATP